MAKQSLVAGLDIGSNQVCCVTGAVDENARLVKILGASSIPCSDGIKAGAVINIQEAAMSIGRACREAEKSAGGQIEDIILAVRGNFVESKSTKGVANINYSNREVTENTIGDALESAKKMINLDSEHEILQIIPKEFILNQQRGIQNPIGMEGTFIEVDVHALIASSSNINNILKAMSSTGVKCDGKVYSYVAASDVLVTKEEKELGCLVVDFGGLTTGLVHYADGIIRTTNEIQVGSDYITRDIMHKLRASFATAKEIKELYGCAYNASKNFEDKNFEYKGADGRSVRKYSNKQLMEIIQPRVDQILFVIEDTMKKSPYGMEFLSGGIILTGAGCLLKGIPEAFEKYFGCSVHIGMPNPDKIVGPIEISGNPTYTTAIGALASLFNGSYISSYSSKSSGSGAISKVMKWFSDNI